MKITDGFAERGYVVLVSFPKARSDGHRWIPGNGVSVPADQRGTARVGPCDIGAYEFGGVPASLVFADGFESGDTSLWDL